MQTCTWPALMIVDHLAVPTASARAMAREVDSMLGLLHSSRARDIACPVVKFMQPPLGPDEGVNRLITSLIAVKRAEISRSEEAIRRLTAQRGASAPGGLRA
jgi:hypothetical protein